MENTLKYSKIARCSLSLNSYPELRNFYTSKRLKKLGITTIEVTDIFRLKSPSRHALIYQGVKGKLREEY